MSIIDDMARLVLEDPNLTARQLAKKLGYSEQKTVYYWLQKAGFKGLRDFRQALLRGRFPVVAKRAPGASKDAPSVVSMPLYDDERQDLLGELHGLLRRSLGERSFAVVISKKDLMPEAKAGDVLFIDPEAKIYQGDIVAVNVKGLMSLCRMHYSPSSKEPVYVSLSPAGGIVTPELIVGKVVFLLKKI